MFKKHCISVIFFLILVSQGVNICLAQDINFSPITTINPDRDNKARSEVFIDLNQNKDNSKTIDLDENDIFYNFINATDRFVQCNIRASWDDFKSLINNSEKNDFVYMSFANKMADLGLFDLANLAVQKIKDRDIAGISIDAMQRFYYPRRKLKLDDELALAEVYSNILYNNQSSEATNELLKNEAFLANYDYANYLVALGSYKSNFYSRANKYINIAILQNPTNLNYQKLKAEILAENDDPSDALKTVENLKKQNLYSYEYEQKIKSLEQFILYKTKKAEWEKNYHLGYYYYIENDTSKAIRTLQSALSAKRKSDNGVVYALMSEVYMSMKEFEKASDSAKKAYKINKNDPLTLITLGDLCYRDKDYKHSLEYYKKAASLDKKSYTPLVKEAQAYQKLSNAKKAEEIYTKILKTHFDSWEAYYNVALLTNSDKDKKIVYLKKALAVNPLYEDAWIELAKIEIDNGSYEIAQKYLSNAYYIDENDFRYYYYQGLVDKNLGDYTQAEYDFKKCLKLNSAFNDAKNELDNLINTRDKQQPQDNI